MLTYGHRGYHAVVPENTLAAFAAAIAQGAEGIETDVRLSRDGKLILFHERVTPQAYAVRELSHQELERCMGYAIPTLEQALETWTSIRWNIELKTPEVLEAALQVFSHFPNRENLLVTSFDHALMRRCAELLDVPMGLLLYHRPFDSAQFFAGLEACPAHLRSLVWAYEFIDTALISEAVAHGLHNLVFDVCTADEHQACQQLALDAVITDYPQLMQAHPVR
jgi:glycerophosphoryl diester phosphodiesterase